jgi:hypothetical protein
MVDISVPDTRSGDHPNNYRPRRRYPAALAMALVLPWLALLGTHTHPPLWVVVVVAGAPLYIGFMMLVCGVMGSHRDER